MTPSAPGRGRPSPTLLAAALVGGVALLPFVRGLVGGATFYFRDLALFFLPQRLYALSGLQALELRFWNPFTHEGTPAFPPPLSYPVDLLQLLRPDAFGNPRRFFDVLPGESYTTMLQATLPAVKEGPYRLIVRPDGSYRWKDEDELEQAAAVGLLEPAAVREEAARVLREWPFPTGWEDWRPDPAWPIPQLPDGWDRV